MTWVHNIYVCGKCWCACLLGVWLGHTARVGVGPCMAWSRQRLTDERRTGAAREQQLLQNTHSRHTSHTDVPHTNHKCPIDRAGRERGSLPIKKKEKSNPRFVEVKLLATRVMKNRNYFLSNRQKHSTDSQSVSLVTATDKCIYTRSD